MIFFWLIPWAVIGLIAYWGICYAVGKKRPENRGDDLTHRRP
jgi:hypothetical protein